MAEIQIPYLGNIDTDKIEEYYHQEADLKGNKTSVDIHFNKAQTDVATLEGIREFLNKIPELNEANIKEYVKDFFAGGQTHSYIEFYLETFFDGESGALMDTSQDKSSQMKRLLDKLVLKRVGLYPDRKAEMEYYGVFDYSIKVNGAFCNYLLVVKTNDKGEIVHITWES